MVWVQQQGLHKPSPACFQRVSWAKLREGPAGHPTDRRQHAWNQGSQHFQASPTDSSSSQPSGLRRTCRQIHHSRCSKAWTLGSSCSGSESLLTVAVLVGKAVELSLTALHLAEEMHREQIQSPTTKDSTACIDVGP